MSATPRILVFAGSTRTGSFNKKVARIAARFAEEAGAEVTLIDLRELPMPLYDGDLESAEGIPANAMQLRRLMVAHDGFLLACPEYNSSISGVLKNAIDWVSRPVKGEPELVAFKGKIVGLMSASPGALGGIRSLITVRSILGNIGCVVLPDQASISRAHEAFDEVGNLKDAAQAERVRGVVRSVVEIGGKLKS
jgi:chromate reductase, NAD(P)H dehydrogenase (quinone)